MSTDQAAVLPLAPEVHRAVLARWLESLIQLPEVEAVWLEGSMARGQANPASDIDVRIALADAAYTELWENERIAVLQGLGEYLLLETRFVRALTIEGIIVELWHIGRVNYCRSSRMNGCP